MDLGLSILEMQYSALTDWWTEPKKKIHSHKIKQQSDEIQ